MKRIYNKIVAMLLAIAMVVTLAPVNEVTVYAAGNAAQGSTTEIDDPAEATVNAEVYFVSAATGKIITLNGVVDDPIDCTLSYDENNIPDNAKFKIYYATATGNTFKGDTIVNFTCSSGTSWKADGSKVFQIRGRTNPSGWESVYIEPQGDGTISFRSNANGDYFTVDGDILGLADIGEGESVSSNEKFIMYTTTAPKTAKKVTLSDVAGDAITVSWTGEKEHLYSAYEVLYSTSEDGEYISAGITGKTSLTVTDLTLNTTYYFKVRTLVNNRGGVYSDSKICYTTTLKEYKPKTPENIQFEYTNEKMNITWDSAMSATYYKIYRANSRFGEYKYIGETTSTSFVDENPNTESKYKNYYKVQGANSVDEGPMSEAASIEINMFGKNAYIFSPEDDQAQIDNIVADIFSKQHYSQFGKDRYALMFKPGDYTSTQKVIETGYYTQILGLGKTPYDVSLYNVHTPAALSNNNVTCNFWQGIENVTIKDLENNGDAYFDFNWAVSQAAPARRLNVERTAHFDWYYGWASGGFFADTHFHKAAGSYSQQQYYYRNCQIDGGIYGVNWNYVAQGTTGITAANSSDNSNKPFANMVDLVSGEGKTNWDQRGCTTLIDETERIREKPFVYFDEETDKYKVFVPAMRKNSSGISWSETNMGEGISLDLEKYFYIVDPEKDNADTINNALELGYNLLFQPGIHRVDKPIRIKQANTIVLGIGMATIIPDNEEAAIIVDDVGGVSVAGLILDAGNYSKTLLTVGEEGCNKDHSENPVVLQDVIYRVGGTGELGRADACQVINSNDVIIDHTWIWRADHGDHVGWTQNTSKNGLVVNGDNVTSYGLFCEHFQEYDIIWRGENGKVYFLQNEKCYDPQDQDAWMSHDGTKLGYAAYKVTNNVKNHYAVGLGIYDVFINTNGASIYLDNAIEVPNTEGVLIENACIVEIANGSGPKVGINHIINNTTVGIRTGEGNNGGYAIQRLLSYCNEESKSLPDYYVNQDDVTVQKEVGETPSNDVYAEKDIVKEESSKDDEIPLWEMTEKDFDNKKLPSYTVNFVTSEGGSLTGSVKQTIAKGKQASKVTAKAKEGYTFEGWKMTVGGSSSTVQNPETVAISADTTFTAVFTPNKYEYVVKYIDKDTKKQIKTSKKAKAAFATTVTEKAPAIDGYKVTGESTQFVTIKLSGNEIVFEYTSTGEYVQPGKAPKKGQKFSAGKYTYKITKISGKKGNVTLVKVNTKYKKKLKKATVKASVKYSGYTFKITVIGKNAFKNCKKLKKVTIGKNVKTIKAKAFNKCNKLKTVVVKGKKLKKIAKNAFAKKVRKSLKIKAKKVVKKRILKSLKRKK